MRPRCPTTHAQVHARLKMGIKENGDTYSHIVKAERVGLDSYFADRCLTLHVNEMGDIVWASKTPKSLFSFDGDSCIGRSILDMIDVLQTWRSEGKDNITPLHGGP